MFGGLAPLANQQTADSLRVVVVLVVEQKWGQPLSVLPTPRSPSKKAPLQHQVALTTAHCLVETQTSTSKASNGEAEGQTKGLKKARRGVSALVEHQA